jgi:hypothetical protein
MSVDGNIAGITGVGGMGGGAAAVVADLAGTGHSVLIGIAVGLALVVVSAIVMRKAHRGTTA